MDISSLVGFLLAVAFMAVGVILGGGSVAAFIDYGSIIIAVGGAIATVMVCLRLGDTLRMPKVCKKVFLYKAPDMPALIEKIIELAEMARRDGVLSLERKLSEIDDWFLVLGLQMAVDGSPPEAIDEVMRTYMEASNARHKDGKKWFDQLGKLAPSFGMIGTLIGLILMLGNLSDPDALGPGMAVAMITTLYGAVIANVFCIPFSEKLDLINKVELQAMEVTVRGVLAIRNGESPRLIDQKLGAFASPRPVAK